MDDVLCLPAPKKFKQNPISLSNLGNGRRHGSLNRLTIAAKTHFIRHILRLSKHPTIEGRLNEIVTNGDDRVFLDLFLNTAKMTIGNDQGVSKSINLNINMDIDNLTSHDKINKIQSLLDS